MSTPVVGAKLRNCTVEWDEGWVEVTSCQTKTSLMIRGEDYSQGWDFCNAQEKTLFDKLMQGPKHARPIQLTNAEMITFRTAYDKADNRNAPASRMEVPEPPPGLPVGVTTSAGPKRQKYDKHEKQTIEQDAENLTRKAERAGTEEARIRAVQQTIEKIKKGIRQLEYYIPAPLSKAGVVPNPADKWHMLGFVPNDGSCYLLSEDLVTHPVFVAETQLWDAWKRGSENVKCWNQRAKEEGRPKDVITGVRYRLCRMHPDELQENYDWAWDRLADRIRDIHTSLLESLLDAEGQYKKKMEELYQHAEADEKAEDKARSYEISRCKQALKQAGKSLDGAVLAAQKFDATEEVKDLFQALREAIVSQQAILNVKVEARMRANGQIP